MAAARMSALQKAQALVSEGLADSLADVAYQLVDMGDISQAAADRIAAAKPPLTYFERESANRDCPNCGQSARAHTGTYCQECGEPLHQ